jgi:hypothetical protein
MSRLKSVTNLDPYMRDGGNQQREARPMGRKEKDGKDLGETGERRSRGGGSAAVQWRSRAAASRTTDSRTATQINGDEEKERQS